MARTGALRPVPADPRARLAARQAELVRALYGGPPAQGLDPHRVRLTSNALARKRARAVARAWPALTRELGAQYAERFVAYARVTPPPDAGAFADGLAFSQVMAREQRLRGDARIEHMLATTCNKLRHNRLAARRGPRLAAAITRPPSRLVIIVSFPPIGARLISIRLPARTRLP